MTPSCHLCPQPAIAETFSGLQLRPDQFPGLLEEMGFLPAQPLGQPSHAASGFSRQLQMFVKVGASVPVWGRGGAGGGRCGVALSMLMCVCVLWSNTGGC